MKRNYTPCVEICQFPGKNKWCIGCGRTREETKKWKSMKPFAKALLLKELKKRMSQVSAMGIAD